MMRLEWLDIVLVLALIGILVFSAYSIYLHREPEKLGNMLQIESLNLSKPQVGPSKPNSSVDKIDSPRRFDHPKIKLNDTDLRFAFGDAVLQDAFRDKSNILIAMQMAGKMEYFTIRLVDGAYTRIEYRLYSNAVRIDTDVESFNAFIMAAQNHDYSVMKVLLQKKVHISDDLVKQRLDDTLAVY